MRRVAGLLSVFCVLFLPSAAHAEVALLRAEVTSSISRSLEPRRPLESVRIPSAVYFYVKVKGVQPGYNHQVFITVLDGAKQSVGRHQFGTVPRTTEQVIFFPIIPKTTHAPGTWTFEMAIDGRSVARIEIPAGPDGGAVKGGHYERQVLPAVALALALLAAYLGYGLYASGGVTATGAPPSRSIGDPALFALVAANLLPLAFVYYGYANAADLLFIYWAENLVVAFYAIQRMALARGPGSQRPVLIGILIFILHFGIFVAMHGLLLLNFARDQSSLFELDPAGMLNADVAAEFAGQPADPFRIVPAQMILAVLALLVSHGVSYVHNYIRRGEFLVSTPQAEMMRPYRRMMAMHVAAVLTGFLATSRGSPLAMLVLVVLIKTGVDVYSHVRSHVPAPVRA